MVTLANISRRRFLGGLLYVSLLEVLQAGWNLNKLRPNDDTQALISNLADFYADKHSAKIVGLEYLRAVPVEAKTDLLLDLICSFEGEQQAEFAQADKHKMRELLLLRQCQDFEHGHVINVRGWILSQTECRLCALTALS
jgi:hypothetical protein